MTTVKRKVMDLRPGDVLASGSVVLGYDRIGKGGAHYRLRRPDGTECVAAFDRRRKIEVTPAVSA